MRKFGPVHLTAADKRSYLLKGVNQDSGSAR